METLRVAFIDKVFVEKVIGGVTNTSFARMERSFLHRSAKREYCVCQGREKVDVMGDNDNHTLKERFPTLVRYLAPRTLVMVS